MTNRILQLITAATLLHLLVSVRLWLPIRHYPKAEIIPLSTELAFFVEILLFILILTVLSKNFARPRKGLIIAFISLFSLYCVLDLNRLHPALYEYLLIYLVYLFAKNDKKIFLNLFLLILVGTYLWSGLNKLNYNFFASVVPGFAGVFPDWMPEIAQQVYMILLSLSPLIEVIAGLALLFLKVRKPAACILIVMHFMIMLTLINLDHNIIVWPWNVLNIFLLYFAAQSTEVFKFKSVLNTYFARVLVFIVFLLPALGLFNLVDQVFSFNLYTGRHHKLFFYFQDGAEELLPQNLQLLLEQEGQEKRLSMTKLSNYELNIPTHDSAYAMKKSAEDFCKKFKYDKRVRYQVMGRPKILSSDRAFVFARNCSDGF